MYLACEATATSGGHGETALEMACVGLICLSTSWPDCAVADVAIHVCTLQTVRNILRQAYGRKDAVTDELVRCILTPGLQDGAVYVFLDFISYSGGPVRVHTHTYTNTRTHIHNHIARCV